VVEIKGIEKFASRDFPGHISSTVFLGGCNFRCPYCHNAELVLRPGGIQTVPLDIFLTYLDGRKGWLEGVCITGGEPLLHEGCEDLIRIVKDRGLLVKLDTNGSFPGPLENLIAEGLLDWVAMDIKAPLERYREVTRSDVDIEAVVASVDLLKRSEVRTIFRTTVVPEFVGLSDVVKIGEWLDGAESFVVQSFVPHDTLDPAFLERRVYRRDELDKILDAAKPFFQNARIERP
jgi:pyruvate formate lyase activating enzyme